MVRSEPSKALNEKNRVKRAEAAADLAAMVNTLGQKETVASLSHSELRGFVGRLCLGASRAGKKDMATALSRYLETQCPIDGVASGCAQNGTSRASSEETETMQSPAPDAGDRAESKATGCAQIRASSTSSEEAETMQSPAPDAADRAESKATLVAKIKEEFAEKKRIVSSGKLTEVVRSKRKTTGSVQAPTRRRRQKQPVPIKSEPGQATADLDEMTVRDLRGKCQEFFVSQRGSKQDLIARIVKAERLRATIGVAGAGAASALAAAVGAVTAAYGVDAWPQALAKQVRALNLACAEWGGDDLPARPALEQSIVHLEALGGELSDEENVEIRDRS